MLPLTYKGGRSCDHNTIQEGYHVITSNEYHLPAKEWHHVAIKQVKK